VITVVINPAAGTNPRKNSMDRVAELFERAGAPARLVPLTSGVDAVPIAREAIESGAGAVVAAGGDGTVNRVVSALAGSNTPLGVIPLGTLNHFAKDLHLPLDLEDAVSVIAARHVKKVDVGVVNDRVFVNNSSIGVYPSIVVEREELRRRRGYGKWRALAVATAHVLRHYRGITIRIDAGDSPRVVRTPFFAVGNNEYLVDGMRLGARVRLDAGRLLIYYAPRVHTRDLPELVVLALLGHATDSRVLESFAAETIQVDSPSRRTLRVAFDGEVARMATPLRYRTWPGALNVIVPVR
jgi:diacylglycerol kinase family enzyme